MLLDLGRFAPGLIVRGHLPECPNPQHPVQDCDWCLWAIGHSGIREICNAVVDIRSLIDDHDRRRGDVSVAWVVAAGDLLEPFERAAGTDGVPDDLVVTSVRDLYAKLHHSAMGDANDLGIRLDTAVASGGPVEGRCLAGAATVVSAALQRPEERHRRESLSVETRRILDRASLLVSVENQAEHLRVDVERLHWDGIPDLRTQPEWRRRPAAGPTAESEQRPAERGSLESFVVEAVMDDLVDDLDRVATDLAGAAGPVVRTEDPSRRRLSSSTRHMIWRRARIDWHLTFLDTGRAACWLDEDGVTRMPWTVDLAIDEGARLGLVSATHCRDSSS